MRVLVLFEGAPRSEALVADFTDEGFKLIGGVVGEHVAGVLAVGHLDAAVLARDRLVHAFHVPIKRALESKQTWNVNKYGSRLIKMVKL